MLEPEVSKSSENESGYVFDVKLGEFEYQVQLSREYYQKLTNGMFPPEQLVGESFKFLLEREGPESIMRQFELPLIGNFFPEYERAISGRLK